MINDSILSLKVFISSFLKENNLQNTYNTFKEEVLIPENIDSIQNPINSKKNFLEEWWEIFFPIVMNDWIDHEKHEKTKKNSEKTKFSTYKNTFKEEISLYLLEQQRKNETCLDEKKYNSSKCIKEDYIFEDILKKIDVKSISNITDDDIEKLINIGLKNEDEESNFLNSFYKNDNDNHNENENESIVNKFMNLNNLNNGNSQVKLSSNAKHLNDITNITSMINERIKDSFNNYSYSKSNSNTIHINNNNNNKSLFDNFLNSNISSINNLQSSYHILNPQSNPQSNPITTINKTTSNLNSNSKERSIFTINKIPKDLLQDPTFNQNNHKKSIKNNKIVFAHAQNIKLLSKKQDLSTKIEKSKENSNKNHIYLQENNDSQYNLYFSLLNNSNNTNKNMQNMQILNETHSEILNPKPKYLNNSSLDLNDNQRSSFIQKENLSFSGNDNLNSNKNKRGSKFRGVSRNGNQWQVLIMVLKKKRYVGSYSDEEEAARAYDKATLQNHGLKAKTNFDYTPEELEEILKQPPILRLDKKIRMRRIKEKISNDK